MQRVPDKVIIVTGGASGIGRATAILLAQHGAKVAICDIDAENGEKVAQQIKANNHSAKYWPMDVTDENAIQRVFAEIYAEFSYIDGLVNNAGIPGVDKPTHEVTRQEWELVMRVNTTGVFLCTKHVIPYLRKGSKGNIVNISSIDGIVGGPDYPPYHASKAAVRLMTKTDALLYAKNKIRVNAICPGYIWTPLMKNQVNEYPGGITAFNKKVSDLHPLGHMGKPEDIAYGVLYLTSDEAEFITGSELIIDGGFTAR